MLRKDVIYMTSLHWEPKIPSVDEIRRQITNKQISCDNSVRLTIGKVFVKNKELFLIANGRMIKRNKNL